MGADELPATNLQTSGIDPNKPGGPNEGIAFTGRVHNLSPNEGDGSIALLLRKNGRFFRCKLKSADGADPAICATARRLTPESLVRISCGVIASDNASSETFTITQVSSLVILSEAKANLAGNVPKLHGAPGEPLPPLGERLLLLDTRLDNRLLDARVAATASIFKIFSAVHNSAVKYLAGQDFHYIPTPAFVGYEFPAEEEDHFYLDYLGRQAMLAPTGEVHLGMALAADLERVYDIHTVFRREPKSDGRHLTEFTMLELVFALNNDWTEILELADSLLVFLLRSLQEDDKSARHTAAAQRLYPAAGSFKLGLDKNGKLPRVRFDEAKAILRDHLGKAAHVEEDLTRDEEALLGHLFASNQSPLDSPPTDVFIITHFPKHLRPCNVSSLGRDDATTNSFDIILRGQEIVTGCQLLHSHEEVRAAFTNRAHPIDPDCPGWQPYTEAHEIGMPPWGGFGLGLNRLVQGYLGLGDVRETVLFPRDACRLAP
ncbi:class II aaRS and biotin synthetase [Trichoderma citrinoviride]|uniref:aspartate--tRNA ligase n=1 Tax=Trichoderma citrinoviride TaxID=58853 RepID=A0A2T4AYV9_9HYPO|nr:class II aaRS and biotin synthetase [Trichoderma citrinoviride]PTB62253.1 class II aaRS and biotin synthetase [Trichoderma citrinoviride]